MQHGGTQHGGRGQRNERGRYEDRHPQQVARDEERAQPDDERVGVHAADLGREPGQHAEEAAFLETEAQDRVEVRQADRDADAHGEADDDRVRHEPGHLAHPEKPHEHQDDAGDDGTQDEEAVVVLLAIRPAITGMKAAVGP